MEFLFGTLNGFPTREVIPLPVLAIGIVAEHRSKGIGSGAQQFLADYRFSHTRVDRIQEFTDVENIAECRALEKSGFELEGILRRAQFRSGNCRNMAL